MGTWYELMHYPSWFQRNDNYNTMAQYELVSNDQVKVHNSTIVEGNKFESYGTAKRLGINNFHVEFSTSEVENLANSGQFKSPNIPSGFQGSSGFQDSNDSNYSNYVIDKIWVNECGDYIFAIVTDSSQQSLYVLSRYKHPALTAYNELMVYIITKYDRDRLVQTPHFD
jgi:lipocalin